jgi:hypothetical protein
MSNGNEITVKIKKILVPKDEFKHCDIAGCSCMRTVCYACNFKNPKREKLLKDKNNLREETDAEQKLRLYVFFHPDNEYTPSDIL